MLNIISQIKTEVKYHYTSTKISGMAKTDNTQGLVKDLELELYYTVGGNAK